MGPLLKNQMKGSTPQRAPSLYCKSRSSSGRTPASLHPRLRGLVKDKQLALDLQHKGNAHEPPGSTSHGPGDTSGPSPLFCPAFKLKWISHFQKSIKKNHYGNANQNHNVGDLSGGPTVKNLSSSTGDTGSPLLGELRSYML